MTPTVRQLVVTRHRTGTPTPTPGLPAFAYQAETTTATSAYSSAGYTAPIREQRQLDYWVRKLKAAGTWGRLSALYIQTNNQAASLINLKSPGTNNLTIEGTPTFTTLAQTIYSPTNDTLPGFKAAVAADRLNTGITLASVSGQDVSLGVYVGRGSSGTGIDAGAQDSTAGLTVQAWDSSVSTMNGRGLGTAIGATGASTDYEGYGLHAVSRAGANVERYRNGRRMASSASTAVASVSSNAIKFLGATGSTASSTHSWQGGYVGIGLTQADHDLIYRAMRTMIEARMWGHPLIHEQGYALDNDTFDLVIYGWTSGSVIAAIEAKRRGLSVALVGGWRDITADQIGGMTTNGLGATDINQSTTLRGLTRYFYQLAGRINNVSQASITSVGALTSTARVVGAKNSRFAMRAMLDPATSIGQDVPVFATGGVTGYTDNSAGTYASITTADGRVFKCKKWIDGSEEADLAVAAGVPFIMGLEAGNGQPAGYRGTLTTQNGNDNQMSSPVNSTLYNISPWVDGSTEASGMIYGVTAAPALAVGDGVNRTQSYCFRVDFQSTVARQNPFETAAPTGYADAKYEGLFRLAAAATAGGGNLATTDVFKLTAAADGYLDANNQGGWSMDLMGSGTAFMAATDSAGREAVWKACEAHQRGLIYAVGKSADSRISGTAARTTLAAYGYPNDAWLDPHPNDSPYWPTVLYKRECRRMVGLATLTSANLANTLISTNTACSASYGRDSHPMERMADKSTSPARIWLWGNFLVGTGAANDWSPLPFEIFLPSPTYTARGSWLFAVSASHDGFGACRMEPTLMMAGQAMAIAVKYAIDNGYTMQDACTTNYGTDSTGLRVLMLNAAAFTNEGQLKLPQAFTADYTT